MSVIGRFIVSVIVIIFGAILNGYVLSLLWEWFVVQAFKIAPLNIASAIGIALIFSYLNNRQDNNTKERKDLTEIITNLVLRSLTVLFIGWIVHNFM